MKNPKFSISILVLFSLLALPFQSVSSQNDLQNNLNHKLLLASKNKDHDSMKQLISQGANVNYTEPPLSPLIVSIIMEDAIGVDLLLRNKADISLLNNTALLSACSLAYPEIIKMLIDNGAVFKGEAKECLHAVAMKLPRNMRWFFLGKLLTQEEVSSIDFSFLELDEESRIAEHLKIDNKPYFESIDVLIGHKFPKNQINAEGMSALDVAIETRNIPMIYKLLQEGLIFNKPNFASIDIATIAVQVNNIEILKSILKNTPHLINLPNSEGDYLITESFKHRREEIAAFLINNEVNLDVSDSNKNTLLHYAALWGNDQYISKLSSIIRSGVNKKNSEGVTPLYLAALQGRKEYFYEMERYGDLNDPLFNHLLIDTLDALKRNSLTEIPDHNFGIIRHLNNKNINLNGVRNYQNALVRLLTQFPLEGNNLRMARILVEKENNLELLNAHLPLFIENFGDDFVQLLIAKGVSKNVALYHYITRGNEKMVKWLINLIPDPGLPQTYIQNPLNLAVLSGNISIVRILLESKKFEVNAKECVTNSPGNTGECYTALDYALMKNNVAVARFLIEHGADINKSSSGNSLLQLLKNNPDADIQTLIGISLLKNQLIFDSRKGNKTTDEKLDIFVQNENINLPEQIIEINQRPQFWSIYPYIARGNASIAFGEPFGYLLHTQKKHPRQTTFKNDRTAKSVQEDFHIHIPGSVAMPSLNMGFIGRTKPFTTIQTASGSISIPQCENKDNDFLCYPTTIINNRGDQPIDVHQPNQNFGLQRIYSGEEFSFDRSDGKLEVRYNIESSLKISLSFSIEYNIGPQATLSDDTSLLDRLNTYVDLNEARLKIESGSSSSREINTLKTYTHVLSLKARQKGYQQASSTELRHIINSLNSVQENVSILYESLYSLNNIIRDKNRIIGLLEKIISTGDVQTYDTQSYQRFKNEVEGARTEQELLGIINVFLEEKVFKEIEDKLFKMQLLILESAQYLPAEDVVNFVDEIDETLINKKLINPKKIIISSSDLNGHGDNIINVFTRRR
jgi:ankyrin repeat protein